ncbi:hypothetical protein BY996DRAFT_6582642 [Phakopsora pachyrhizi]|nr:hypothetical protein BY996DRAFT_6582642 [Phakopsora pachyrhizi]
MSQYGGYGNPYYGGYYYPYDKQTPYYGYGQPDYVTCHAEGSGSSFTNFEDNQPPHGYPRINPEYQSPYDVNPSRSTPQSSYMQDHARSDDDHRNFLDPENEYLVPETTFPSGSYSINEVGLTRVAAVAENYQKQNKRGLGRVGNRWKGNVDIAGPTTYRRANDVRDIARPMTYRRTDGILQGRRQKGLYGDTIAGQTKARIRFGGIKDCLTDKEARAAGEDIKKDHNWKEEVSVGLVRRREMPRRPKGRTDIWGISKTVVGRGGVGPAEGLGGGHTEVRSSYHFRVITEANSATLAHLITITDSYF